MHFFSILCTVQNACKLTFSRFHSVSWTATGRTIIENLTYENDRIGGWNLWVWGNINFTWHGSHHWWKRPCINLSSHIGESNFRVYDSGRITHRGFLSWCDHRCFLHWCYHKGFLPGATTAVSSTGATVVTLGGFYCWIKHEGFLWECNSSTFNPNVSYMEWPLKG